MCFNRVGPVTVLMRGGRHLTDLGTLLELSAKNRGPITDHFQRPPSQCIIFLIITKNCILYIEKRALVANLLLATLL